MPVHCRDHRQLAVQQQAVEAGLVEGLLAVGNADQLVERAAGGEDAVRAVITLSETDSTIGDYFNVGGTGEITIKELATKIIERTDSKSTLKHIPYTEAYPAGFEDLQRRVPDITKIKKTINWQPSHTLDSIIDSVAASLKK